MPDQSITLVETLIQRILDTFSKDDFKPLTSFPYCEEMVLLLDNSFEIIKKLHQDLDNLRVSIEEFNWEGIFSNLKKSGRKIEYSLFVREIDARVTVLKGLPCNQYRIIFPIQITFDKIPEGPIYSESRWMTIQVKDNQYFQDHYASAIRKYDPEAVKLNGKIEEDFMTPSVFLCEFYARDPLYAFTKAYEVMQLLLGVVAFSRLKKETIRFFPRNDKVKVLKYINLSYWKPWFRQAHIFLDNNYNSSYIIDRSPGIPDAISIKSKDMIYFLNLIQKAPESKLGDLLVKAFKIYIHALRDPDVTYSFLKFWTIIEILSLKSRDIKETEFLRRLKSIPLMKTVGNDVKDKIISNFLSS